MPDVQKRSFLFSPFCLGRFTRISPNLEVTPHPPVKFLSLVNNARSLPTALCTSTTVFIHAAESFTSMSPSLSLSKEAAVEKKRTPDNASLEGSFEHAERTSLSDLSHSAPRIKWYRSTIYNALVLGLCNFLAPGLVCHLACLDSSSKLIAIITVGCTLEHSFFCL